MAKIIYAINGDGLGHVMRSTAIILELQKRHRIKIVTSSKRAFDALKERFSDVTEVDAPALHYKNNSVDDITTAKLFFKHLIKESPKNLKKTYTLVKTFNPDIIITDFESGMCYTSTMFRIPVICLCNNHALSNLKFTVPEKYINEYRKTRMVVELMCTNIKYHIITTFFYLPTKGKQVFLYPPILRPEILRIKPGKKEHLFIYQTSATNKKLITILRKLDYPCIVYGFNKEAREGNIIFKKFNTDQYFKDFADCKACIANGGFTVISEAVSLHKPVLSIPIKGQFEQRLNALQIKRLGYGDMADVATMSAISHFVKNIPKYQKNLSTYKREDNSRIIKKVEEIIAYEIAKKK